MSPAGNRIDGAADVGELASIRANCQARDAPAAKHPHLVSILSHHHGLSDTRPALVTSEDATAPRTEQRAAGEP